MEVTALPSSVQFTASVEMYKRGNVVSLYYAGTTEAMYKYSGAIFGISAARVRNALQSGQAVSYPNNLGIEKTF